MVPVLFDRVRDRSVAATRRGSTGTIRDYLAGAGGGVLFWVEPKGTAGLVGFFDCLGFFFSLLLRS